MPSTRLLHSPVCVGRRFRARCTRRAASATSPSQNARGPAARTSQTSWRYLRPNGGHGHRILRQWVEGGEVATIYDVRIEAPAGAGDVTMSEWHAVNGTEIVSSQLLLDSAAFPTLMLWLLPCCAARSCELKRRGRCHSRYLVGSVGFYSICYVRQSGATSPLYRN